jgi:hypothetical protein
MAHLSLRLDLLQKGHKIHGYGKELPDEHGHGPKGMSVSVRSVR